MVAARSPNFPLAAVPAAHSGSAPTDATSTCELPLLVLDGLAAGVVAVGADGLVHYANVAAARLLRRPLTELVHRTLSSLLAPLSDSIATDDSSPRRGEIAVPIDGGSLELGYSITTSKATKIILFQDISPVNELRRQRDHLLQIAALGDALPTVLHELRNPLAAITTALEVIVEDASEPLQSDLYAVLSELRRVHLSLQGVGGLLRSVRAPSHCAIDLALNEACRVLEPTATRKGITLKYVSDVLPLLPLDRGVLSGVTFNLVKNAIDACSSGDNIEVRLELSTESFRLTVADTGHGMTDEVRKRCTELFFTKNHKGSGIGLALCKNVADESGGTLLIHSAPGKGTTVTLSIPLLGPDEPAPGSRTRR